MSWLIVEGVGLTQNFSLNYSVVIAMPCLEGAIFTSNLNCRDHPMSTLTYALRLSIASEVHLEMSSVLVSQIVDGVKQVG